MKKLKDKSDLEEINKEYKILKESQKLAIYSTDKIQKLFQEIKEINQKLWEIEDEIRNCEKKKDFGQTFVSLARSVYFNNDKRAKIKSEINKLLGSNIKEIKQYSNY